MSASQIVVVGGGHATEQLCARLVEADNSRPVRVISSEAVLPYHRPPLSKNYLKTASAQPTLIRQQNWYDTNSIALELGRTAVSIDRVEKTVKLDDERVIPYEKLVLATGSRARAHPLLPNTLENVLTLRDLGDAQRLRQTLHACGSLAIIGGGFIGLEVAAIAKSLGKEVTVVEASPRIMGRAVSAEISDHVRSVHESDGVNFKIGTVITDVAVDGNRLDAVTLSDSEQPLRADVFVVSIGSVPNTSLAEAAGIACEDGILVDAQMLTSDRSVFAVGDCARFPVTTSLGESTTMRLESIQSASVQARAAAYALVGRAAPKDVAPWFWSDQGGLKIQMAGILPREAQGLQSTRRAGNTSQSFTLFHSIDEKLVAVEAVNASSDYLAARALLDSGAVVDVRQLADTGTSLVGKVN